jgi:hypothetical protein
MEGLELPMMEYYILKDFAADRAAVKVEVEAVMDG